jgi:hypothetical protein
VNVWYFIEKGYLTELFMSDLDEITEVFNGYDQYVPISLLSSFELEATQLQKSYQSEKAITENKAKEDYISAQNSGINISIEMTPEFIVDSLKEETKIKLINLISKYYDKDYYNSHKKQQTKPVAIKKPKTKYDLLMAMNSIRNQLSILLGTIGYYRVNKKFGRKWSYFMSKDAAYRINCDYNNAVRGFNALRVNLPFMDVFKRRTIVDDKDDYGTEFIDLDSVSLLNLIYPHLNANIDELCEICYMTFKWLNTRRPGKKIDELYTQIGAYLDTRELEGAMVHYDVI